MTQTPPSYYSFHFLGLGQAGTIISAEGKCHQMELLHVFLIAEQTLIVRKTFKPSPPPPRMLATGNSVSEVCSLRETFKFLNRLKQGLEAEQLP